MSQRTIITVLAVAAVAYVLGYRKGLAQPAAANAQPTVGGGVDWLNWQA